MKSTEQQVALEATPADGTRGRIAEIWLTVLCCAIYFTSYMTRKGYDASILAICEDTGLARTALGLASTAAVAVYGTGQFVTGFLADRFDSRRLIFIALLITAACNASMTFIVGCIPAMVALWAVNGFAQAMFWPPLIKIVAANLKGEAYSRGVFWISVASNCAIIMVFVLVSSCIRFAGWRLSFWIVSAMAVAMAAIWSAASPRLSAAGGGGAAVGRADSPGARVPLMRLVVAFGLFYIMAAIACQGVMRDGIEVWAPSIFKDQYGLGTSGSTLSVVLLPIFAIVSMAVARGIRRRLGNELKAAVALFGTGLACAAVLYATNGAVFAVGLPLIAILSATMHGVNLMLIVEVPGRFAKYGRVGSISGMLNAFTYVGAAISIYGFAALHERYAGWRAVFLLWIVVLSSAIALTLLALRRQSRSGVG